MKIRRWTSIAASAVLASLITWSSLSSATEMPMSSPPPLPMPDEKLTLAQAPVLIPQAPTLEDAKGYVLMDASNGQVIAEKNMSQRMDPASLTKMMTLYLTFQALKSGQIHLSDKVLVSKEAWKMDGSRMFIQAGTEVEVGDLIQGVIVASGNDACVALAEHIAGTEETFANLMNQTAQRLGMKDTHYQDSTGLPNPGHYATPYDLALLARALVLQFPEYYPYFSQQWFTYNHIKQPNRNRLLWRDKSVDGIKTGHTDDAGYCLISSAKRGNMRLITVVMGTPSDAARADDSQALLTYGFRFYENHLLFKAGAVIAEPRVWMGREKTVKLGVNSDFYITSATHQYNQLQAKMKIQPKLRAPIVKNQSYGKISVTLEGKTIATVPLVALEDNKEGNWFSRLIDFLMLLFHRSG